jgi:hypothetical protein
MAFNADILMTFLALLGAPALAAWLIISQQKITPSRWLKLSLGATLILILTICAHMAKVDFWSSIANTACLLMAWASYTVLASLLTRRRFFYSGAVLLTPIIAVALATPIAALGIFFVVGDYAEQGKIEDISSKLACETRMWGGAMTDSGEVTFLYEKLPLGLRRELASRTETDTQGDRAYDSSPEIQRCFRSIQ